MALGVIHPTRQHTPHACALASLAMVIGRDYQEVYRQAEKFYGERLKEGVYRHQMFRLARWFDVPLKEQKPFELDEHEGILYVARRRACYHAVVLFNGSIYDPLDGNFYEPGTHLESFGKVTRARYTALLVKEQGD